ncbi:MAG TPA: GH3 auxin-responsive promoter family protein [Flavobacteriales bacterium]|nr:GH3 auxin-responsive promoter family protein [Flavobacteriales bacterium]
MAFVGTILQEILKFTKSRRNKRVVLGAHLQDQTLRKLMRKAQFTQFGQKNDFSRLLKTRNITTYFNKNVPYYDYNALYKEWWHKTIEGEENVCWPGKIKYFALTSGTSEAASKRVPVSKELIRQIRKTSIRQMMTIPDLGLNPEFYEKSILGIGGSASLTRTAAGYEGDLSGIIASRLPVWIQRTYKPGKQISQLKSWEHKLEALANEAPRWDVGIIVGVPAWVQLTLERIIDKHNIKNIHEIWPNFNIYVHGGVSFAPYAQSFKRLLGHDLHFMDTYLASEGYMAFQGSHNKLGMELVMDNGIYFEFVPFNENNFDADGNIKSNVPVLTLHEVEENVDYAILISTCAGTWRYLIGDTIRFKSLETFELVITGRTKHFLSLCGEHLSVDNMNMAIKKVAAETGLIINEYAVAGKAHEGLFAHHWYIGADRPFNAPEMKEKIDNYLKELNDDYVVERRHALKDIFIHQIPLSDFYGFMQSKGKLGGQHKFPRVLKGKMLEDWDKFIAHKLIVK